jgi:hypothetical protein
MILWNSCSCLYKLLKLWCTISNIYRTQKFIEMVTKEKKLSTLVACRSSTTRSSSFLNKALMVADRKSHTVVQQLRRSFISWRNRIATADVGLITCTLSQLASGAHLGWASVVLVKYWTETPPVTAFSSSNSITARTTVGYVYGRIRVQRYRTVQFEGSEISNCSIWLY